MKKLEYTVDAKDQGERLDRFLASRGNVSRTEARRLLDRGAVWIDDLRVKIASKPVNRGQRVVVVLEEGGRTEPSAQKLEPDRVLFQDAHLIAVDKPVGVPAQATLATDRGNLVTLVSDLVGSPVGLVHRLDLETSGVTVFAKTKPATASLADAFRLGTAHKRYLAVAVGTLADEVRCELPISPDGRRWGKFRAMEAGKVPAATRFKVLARHGDTLALECFPETGRTHQIRVHLKALGAPIAGDDLYGGPKEIETAAGKVAAARVMLHARSLEIPHPVTGQVMKFEAPVPKDLETLLVGLGVEVSKL
ncbi:MAG TPA: RluA family pseudouridine synthase [Myxococcales bacterium]